MKVHLALRRYAPWIAALFASLIIVWIFTHPRRRSQTGNVDASDATTRDATRRNATRNPFQQLQSKSLKGRLQRLKLRRRKKSFHEISRDWNVNLAQDASLPATMSGDAFQKLVHLDLKGAPPRIEYLQELLPFLKQIGTTGLLVEYEDTFPFKGELSPLSSPHAYTETDISTFLALAKDCSLTVIPLMQTFGHFEFVLKHEQFLSLREVEGQPFALCPRNPKSLPFVEELVDQVLRLHPDIDRIHIGADEVWNIGRCGACQAWMQEWISTSSGGANASSTPSPTVSEDARDALFLDHVIRLATYLGDKYPKVKLIMWDDMFRDARTEILDDSQIGKFVEPMVWKYTPSLDFPADMWDRYARVFDTVWVGSAFKGATGPNQYVTDIAYHIENHVSWLAVVEKEAKKFKNGIRGIAITGWQRYDHFSGLCELIPSALPSLALCIATILQGEFTPQILSKISQLLGFGNDIPLRAFPRPIVLQGNGPLAFPGEGTYKLVNSLANLDAQYHPFIHGDMLNTWFNPYHVKRNFTNPWRVHQFSLIMEELLQNYTTIWQSLSPYLSKIFYPDAVEEIFGTLFDPKIRKLEKLLDDAHKQVAIGGRPSAINQEMSENAIPQSGVTL